MNYPSLSESYFMDSPAVAPEWVCVECVREVFADEDGALLCSLCGDDLSVCAGSVWEELTGESWY